MALADHTLEGMLPNCDFPPTHCVQLALAHPTVGLGGLLDAFERGFPYAGYR
jgi:hypothetical protein